MNAVLIGSPDHWHVPMTVNACAAGKDVYVEKPLTHDPSEGERVIKAQDDHKRVVQVGQQQRSMPHIIKAGELIKAGRIGKVFKMALSWNRNTGDRFARGPERVDPQPGRLERLPRGRPRTSRSTSTGSGTGDGSGTSAAAS